MTREIKYEVGYDNVFEPWKVSHIREIIAEYRVANEDGTLSKMHDKHADFERLHPIIAKRLHGGIFDDPPQLQLLEKMLEVREKRESNAISEEDAVETVTDASFRYFKNV